MDNEVKGNPVPTGPPKTRQEGAIFVRLGPDLYAAVNRAADLSGMTTARFVRNAVSAYLKKYGPPRAKSVPDAADVAE